MTLWFLATVAGFAGGRRGGPHVARLLPTTVTVAVEDKLVRFTRPGVTEEYSVSVDGLRQDFVIMERPAGEGKRQRHQHKRHARAVHIADALRP